MRTNENTQVLPPSPDSIGLDSRLSSVRPLEPASSNGISFLLGFDVGLSGGEGWALRTKENLGFRV